jgi:hypothetical protein
VVASDLDVSVAVERLAVIGIGGKTDFILKVLREMGSNNQQLTAIGAVNRLKA